MTGQLIHPCELDSRLRYPSGRSLRMARRGQIPHVLLPDGEIRFDVKVIDEWLAECARQTELVPEASR